MPLKFYLRDLLRLLLWVFLPLGIVIYLLLLVAGPYHDGPSMRAVTRSDLNNLRSALAMYASDWGCYPPSGNANLVEMLRIVPKGAASGTYMSFKRAQFVNGQFIDPFGRPYVYLLRGDDPRRENYDIYGNFYYLYSRGHNGIDESAGILAGWETGSNDPNRLEEEPGDDITTWR